MEKQEYRIGSGASSLLMILVVLSLTALSVLSLMTARADEKLAERHADMTADYYEAEARAQRFLFELDESLFSLVGLSDAEYEATVRMMDFAGVTAELGEDMILRCEIETNAERTLAFELRVDRASVASRANALVSYRLEDGRGWEPDAELNLFD